jgi:hypothetical protein
MNCKGCGEKLISRDHGEYCADCCCPDCGNSFDTENEKAVGICETCESEA